MDIKICDIKPGLIKGVDVRLPEQMVIEGADWYEYKCSGIEAAFDADKLDVVYVKMWHHQPVFKQIEMHYDTEVQLYISGTAIMLFMDVINKQPVMNSAQIIRIKPGTCLAINKGKAHFVPVSEDDCPAIMAVTMPIQEFPHYDLPEPINGIK